MTEDIWHCEQCGVHLSLHDEHMTLKCLGKEIERLRTEIERLRQELSKAQRLVGESIDWQRDLERTKFRNEQEIARLKLREEHILAILRTVVEAAKNLGVKSPVE